MDSIDQEEARLIAELDDAERAYEAHFKSNPLGRVLAAKQALRAHMAKKAEKRSFEEAESSDAERTKRQAEVIRRGFDK